MIFSLRKTLLSVLALLVCGGLFAQYASFYNRLSSVLVIQDAEEGASASFGSISDRVVGRYDSEKFTLWGRAEFTLESENQWNHNVQLTPTIMEFAGAIRPFPFLELMLGKGYGGSKGEFALTGYTMTGAYGYATEASYGLRKWADGEGFTILFRGDGLGIEGLRIGWNALPILRNSQDAGDLVQDGKAKYYTTLSANYTLANLISFNLAGRFDSAADANQTIGIYTEFIGVPGLRANAGVTMDTNQMLKDPFYVAVQARAMVWNSSEGNLFPAPTAFTMPAASAPAEFSAAVNAGVEYSFKELGLPLMLAADMGITAGWREVQTMPAGVPGQYKILPLLVGGLVQYNVSDDLYLRVQARYADNFASAEEQRLSVISVLPRVHYNAGALGEFRLEPVITVTKQGTASSEVGFLVGAFWQYNF